jgi:hypothetical protein
MGESVTGLIGFNGGLDFPEPKWINGAAINFGNNI